MSKSGADPASGISSSSRFTSKAVASVDWALCETTLTATFGVRYIANSRQSLNLSFTVRSGTTRVRHPTMAESFSARSSIRILQMPKPTGRWAEPPTRDAAIARSIGRHFGVPHRVLDVLVPEIVLQSARVVPVVGELEELSSYFDNAFSCVQSCVNADPVPSAQRDAFAAEQEAEILHDALQLREDVTTLKILAHRHDGIGLKAMLLCRGRVTLRGAEIERGNCWDSVCSSEMAELALQQRGDQRPLAKRRQLP
jgi:hypothetical protein